VSTILTTALALLAIYSIGVSLLCWLLYSTLYKPHAAMQRAAQGLPDIPHNADRQRYWFAWALGSWQNLSPANRREFLSIIRDGRT